MDTFIDKLSLELVEVVDQRLKEICAVRPVLLEQRENVIIWEKREPGNPLTVSYTVTLYDEEVAKFHVEYEVCYSHLRITASEPIFIGGRNA